MARGLLVGSLLALSAPSGASQPVPEAFQAQLRCPFAKVWLEHGPERAAEILGVAPHMPAAAARRLEDTVWGTCKYRNNFARMDVCMEFHGDSWTDATATSRCERPMGSMVPTTGTLEKDARCDTSGDLAGWCATEGGKEMTPMFKTGTCAEVTDSCVTWASGTFTLAGVCATETSGQVLTGGPPQGVTGGPPARCTLAPGPIGAAHQLAQAPGYDHNCEGTPAQRSPYMWPLRWSANVDAKSLGYQTDDVQYESRGLVWYMLDKNWKRLDTLYQRGVQRAVGQSPCDTPTNDPLSCNRTHLRNQTMLHRNNKMVFIDWNEDGTIFNCSWLDMSVIGNIRPDWFMDARGDSTDVQYIGDSHVYYMGEPRLVKQWRKKDFANQYFTMSMQQNPGSDGVHWPLILNVPGEGFGDDFLQHWYNHRMLNESEEAAFLLDEQHVAANGSCPQRASSGSAGPPTGQQEHVPSNLEIEASSWRSIVYTASPVWSPPEEDTGADEVQVGAVEVGTGVTVEACFDDAASALHLSLEAEYASAVWVSVGFRNTSECLMTPRGGGDGEVVYAHPTEAGGYEVGFGPLALAVRHFQPNALPGFIEGLRPLAQVDTFVGGGMAEHSNGHLKLNFTRTYATKPSVFNLSFAYGNIDQGASVGYHKSRGCFALENVRPCPAPACASCPVCGAENSEAEQSNEEQNTGGTALAAPVASLVLPTAAWVLAALIAP